MLANLATTDPHLYGDSGVVARPHQITGRLSSKNTKFMLVVGLSFLLRLVSGYLRCRALPCLMLLLHVRPFRLSQFNESTASCHNVREILPCSHRQNDGRVGIQYPAALVSVGANKVGIADRAVAFGHQCKDMRGKWERLGGAESSQFDGKGGEQNGTGRKAL